MGGTPEVKPELYRERSPITYIENFKSPVLIIRGENDPRCPVQPARKFYEKSQKLNLPVKLEILKEAGHGASQIPDIIKIGVLKLEHLETLFE